MKIMKNCVNCEEEIDNHPSSDDFCSEDCERIFYNEQTEDENNE